MTVLSIVQSTCDRLGLARPSVVVTSTDTQVRQLFALLLEAADELADHGAPSGWQALQREQTFVTVAQSEQTGTPIPDDFLRFVPDSFYNRSTNRKVTGPLTPQQYQRAQVWPQLVAPYLSYRERDGAFLIDPVPPAGETIAYEYISSYYAVSSAGVAKAAFTADDDTTCLDEELLKKSLRWRWKQAKGLDYGEDMISYGRALESKFGADGGAGELSIGSVPYFYPERLNIPEGSWE